MTMSLNVMGEGHAPGSALSSDDALLKALRKSPQQSEKAALPPFPTFPIEEREWGRQFHDSHPVLRHAPGRGAADYGRKVLGRYTAEQLGSMAPKQIGAPTVGCPHCRKNQGEWKWTPDTPDRMACKACEMVFPNDTYPMDQKRTYLSPFGEKILISFYKDKDGAEYFFDSVIDRKKHHFLRRTLRSLAYLYHETGNEKAAALGISILEGYARSIPHWLTWGDRYGKPKGHVRGYLSSGGPYMQDGKTVYQDTPYCKKPMPYFWHESRSDNVYWFRSIPTMYYAYDLLYKSTHFDGRRSPDGKTSFRFWIENSIFDNQAEYVLSFPWEAQIYNNLPFHLTDLLQVAIVCGRPEYARFLRNWSDRVFYLYECHHDMVTSEGPGYHQTWMSSVRHLYEISGTYRDPQGYTDEPGEHWGSADLRERPAKRRQFWGPSMMHFPDGSVYCIGDSGRSGSGHVTGPLRKSINRIAPGFGLTILGDGNLMDDNQVQAALNWSGGTHAHSHEDVNHLFLFAHGRELFSDQADGWASRMTAGHNTVSIDDKDCGKHVPAGGSLELYTPNLPGLAVTRVESRMAAYKENCDRYRRTLVHNTADINHPYVLDIFEVQGGSKHDFFLQGSAEKAFSQKGRCSLPLGPFNDKPAPQNPDDVNGWAGMFNLKSAAIAKDGYVDFRFEDKTGWGTRTHFQKDPEMTLILGETFNFRFRSSGGYHATLREHLRDDKTIPKLILRHQGADGLKTVYVLVHEVLNGDSVIKGLTHSIDPSGNVAVEVDLGERKDYYAIALEKPGILACGPLKANGTFAAAVTKGAKCDLWMAGATQAECFERRLAANTTAFEGRVERVARMMTGAPCDAYLTDADVPMGDALRHEIVMLEFFDDKGDWLFNLSSEIDRVIADGGKRWITSVQDAGVYMDKQGTWHELFHPHRTASSCRLKIVTNATTVPRLNWSPNKGRYQHYETNDFIMLENNEPLTVSAQAQTAVPVRISGGLGVSGKGSVSAVVNREVNVTVTAENPEGVVVPQSEYLHLMPQLKALPIDGRLLTQGIRWTLCKGRADMQDATTLKAIETGISDSISDSKLLNRRQSMIYDGYLNVPESGKYTFYTRTAGGCNMFVDGHQVIRSPRFEDYEEFLTELQLEKGFHQLRFEFGHNRETGVFHLKMSGPGLNKALIPQTLLYHKISHAKGIAQ